MCRVWTPNVAWYACQDEGIDPGSDPSIMDGSPEIPPMARGKNNKINKNKVL